MPGSLSARKTLEVMWGHGAACLASEYVDAMNHAQSDVRSVFVICTMPSTVPRNQADTTQHQAHALAHASRVLVLR